MSQGDRIVSIKDTYGGTSIIFLELLPKYGVEVVLCETIQEFMETMIDYLNANGVSFFNNEKVENLKFKNSKITFVKSNKRNLKTDEIVLAVGSWSNL